MYSFALKTQRAVEDARRHDGSRQLCLLLLTLSRYDRHGPRVFFLPCAGSQLRCAKLVLCLQRMVDDKTC